MIDGGGPGNRQHDRGSMEQPGHRELGDCCVVLLSHMIQRTARFGEVTGSDREPRYEPEIVRFAVIQHVFVFAISEDIPVLNAYDRNNLLSMFDLFCRNCREPDMPNLDIMRQLFELAQRLLDGYFRV